MNIIFIIILFFFDAFFYGYCYQYRIKHPTPNPSPKERGIGIFGYPPFYILSDLFFNTFEKQIRFLFKEVGFNGRTYVPFYRLLIQWPADIVALYLIYRWGGMSFDSAQLLGMLAAIFLMVKELGYYILLGQLDLLKNFEKKRIDVYWLKRPWFAGSILFLGGFRRWLLYFSSLAGFIILIISNFK